MLTTGFHSFEKGVHFRSQRTDVDILVVISFFQAHVKTGYFFFLVCFFLAAGSRWDELMEISLSIPLHHGLGIVLWSALAIGEHATPPRDFRAPASPCFAAFRYYSMALG